MSSGEAGNPTSFLGKFTVLKDAPRELWITFAVKFLIVAAYGLTTTTITLWLHEFGLNGSQALALVGAWAMVMTVATLLVGSLTDAIGLRRTFFLGVGICLFGRAVMALTGNLWVGVILGMLPLAIGEALGTPVLIAATRKYSATKQRSISFSIIYAILNLGFLAANYLSDGVRQSMGEYGHWKLPGIGLELTTYRTLFLISWTFELLVLPLIWFLREGAEATDEGLKFTPAHPHARGGSVLQNAWQTMRDSATETVSFFVKLVGQDGFYRLLGFLLLLSFLKLVYMQMNFVFPPFAIRELGKGAPYGHLLGINNYFVIIFAPVVGALTQKYSAYWMVVLGAVITAASVFIMALPPELFQSLAGGWVGDWIGHGYLGLHGTVHPYYVLITLFVVVFSLGEVFYSPRVYEYAAAIAPRGQEASYGALSYIPMLLGKLFTSLVSGTLLDKYCPEVGPRHSGMMWLIIALTACIAPVGLLALQGLIRVREVGRADDGPPEAAS